MIRVTIQLQNLLLVLSGSAKKTGLPISLIPTPFNVQIRLYANLSLLRYPITIITSTGILTCYPSISPFGLILGPD